VLSRVGRRLAPERLRRAVLEHEYLRALRVLDPEANRDIRLPADEEVAVESIWVAECYPPSRLGGLIEGLEALRVHVPGGREAAADIVRLYRSGAYTGGSLNLGLFTKRGDGVVGPGYVETDLPRRIKRGRGWLLNLSPSLTAVAFHFELTEGSRLFLNDVFRVEYRTAVLHTTGGSVFRRPENQCVDELRGALDDLTNECGGWIGRHFPGSFGAGLLRGVCPSAIFLTTTATAPFTRPHKFPAWLRILGLDAASEAWDSFDWPGLSLRVPDIDGERHRWWLVGRIGDFLADPDDELQEAYGGPTREGWINRVDEEISQSLMLHATELLLAGMHEAVATSRDSMGETATRKWDSRRLEAMRVDVTSFVRDIEPVAAELSAKDWKPFGGADFRPGPNHAIRRRESAHPPGPAPAPHAKPTSGGLAVAAGSPGSFGPDGNEMGTSTTLHAELADRIRSRAHLLLAAEHQHRDGMATIATFVSAGESYRLGRTVLFVTVILGIITIIAQAAALNDVAHTLLKALSDFAGQSSPTPGLPSPTP